MHRRVLSMVVCLLYGAMLTAQSAPAVDGKDEAPVVVPKGSVTGHVYLGDTGGPARFALVMLKPVPSAESVAAAEKSGNDLMNGVLTAMIGGNKKDAKSLPANANAKKPEDAEQKEARDQLTNAMSTLNDLSHAATAGVDGAYTLTGVKPGTYYVHVVLNGYVDPLKAIPVDQLNNPDTTVQEHVGQQLTTLTIQGGETAHLDLRVERGAAIDGHVTYDDGSPAMGWDVKVIRVKKSADDPAPSDGGIDTQMLDSIAKISHATDDHGHYRIAGLEGGDYIVTASLAAGSPTGGGGILGGQVRLTVWSGDVTSRQDAKPVSVVLGEDKSNVDLVMPLHTLHTVSGKVTAKMDGQGINDAIVTLVDDNAAAPMAFGAAPKAALEDNGSFRFDYVAVGSYTIHVRMADIVQKTGKTMKMMGMDVPDNKTLRSFENGDQKVTVSDADVSGITIGLAEKPKEKDDADNK
jgi:hypothetical protein